MQEQRRTSSLVAEADVPHELDAGSLLVAGCRMAICRWTNVGSECGALRILGLSGWTSTSQIYNLVTGYRYRIPVEHSLSGSSCPVTLRSGNRSWAFLAMR